MHTTPQAFWITPPSSIGENVTFLARTSFDIAPSQLVRPLVLHVSADWRYSLYLNGTFLGNGPVRGSHKRYFYDSYTVTAMLRPGINHLAAEVHSPGRATFSAVPVAPALWLQIAGIVATDGNWQVRPDPSRRADAPLYTPQMGFSEHRDLRREPPVWMTTCDAAPGWSSATVLDHTPGGRQLVPCDIPPLTHSMHTPAHMIECGTVPAQPEAEAEDVRFAEWMQTEPHQASDDAAKWSHGKLTFPINAASNAYALLDFERETFGSVIIDVEASEGTILDLGYGDALYNGRVKTWSEPYRFADRYILRAGRQRIEHTLHDRGFHYLQLVARRLSQPLTIHSLAVRQRAYPLPQHATFSCSDPFLNRLWKLCANTLSICATDTFIDCPWREQALWLNDTLVVYPFHFAFTGDPSLPARCLRLAADGQRANGLIPSVYPSAEVRDSSFPSMSAIYTIMLGDYHLYSGDTALVRELLPTVERALALYETWRDPSGLVADQPGMWNFIEWNSPGSRGDSQPGTISTILNMLIAAAYQSAAVLYDAVDDPLRAATMRQRQEHTLAALCERFWIAGAERFCDGTAYPDSFSQHAHAVGLHYGLLRAPQRDAALRAMLDPTLIQADFYFHHFVLNALATSGHADTALATIRKLWEPVVASGSTTTWETTRGKEEFNGAGSLCHAFACAPLYFMQTVLLGVRPLRPGFTEFTFAPQHLGLDSARGTVPTPHGLIFVTWQRHEDGSLCGEIEIPPATTAVLADQSHLGAGTHTFHLTLNPS